MLFASRERDLNRVAGSRGSTSDEVTLTFGPAGPTFAKAKMSSVPVQEVSHWRLARGRQKRTQPPPPQTFKAFGLTPVLDRGIADDFFQSFLGGHRGGRMVRCGRGYRLRGSSREQPTWILSTVADPKSKPPPIGEAAAGGLAAPKTMIANRNASDIARASQSIQETCDGGDLIEGAGGAEFAATRGISSQRRRPT